jgi:hypothetical protein
MGKASREQGSVDRKGTEWELDLPPLPWGEGEDDRRFSEGIRIEVKHSWSASSVRSS